MTNIFVTIIIFVANVKDFLFTLFDPKGHLVQIHPFDPMLTKKAKVWIAKIKKVVPKLPVTFTGSASLKLPGQKDLDFVIGCEEDVLKKESKKLIKILGNPSKKSDYYIEWRKIDKGVNIDILMTSVKNRMYIRIIDAHETLQKHKHLLKEYKMLKQKSNGQYYKLFERQRAYLFNKIFYKYGRGLDFIFNPR